MSSNTFLAPESIRDVDHARQEEEHEWEPLTRPKTAYLNFHLLLSGNEMMKTRVATRVCALAYVHLRASL